MGGCVSAQCRPQKTLIVTYLDSCREIRVTKPTTAASLENQIRSCFCIPDSTPLSYTHGSNPISLSPSLPDQLDILVVPPPLLNSLSVECFSLEFAGRPRPKPSAAVRTLERLLGMAGIPQENPAFGLALPQEQEQFEEEYKVPAGVAEPSRSRLSPVLSAFGITRTALDPRGNKSDWSKSGGIRGGEKYRPPAGWEAYGLNVLGRYDQGKNDWLANDGRMGEYAVAYHGLSHPSPTVENIVLKRQQLYPGTGQNYYGLENKRELGTKCEVGVYLTPSIETAATYAHAVPVDEDGEVHLYAFVLMCRVRPAGIMDPGEDNVWVVPSADIRPYRLLVLRRPWPDQI